MYHTMPSKFTFNPLTTHTLAQDGYSLIVYGGSAPAAVNGVIPSLRTNPDSEITLNDVQVLDTRTYTWSAPTIHGVAQSPRYAHTAVQVGGLMIVMGGELQTRENGGKKKLYISLGRCYSN